MMNFFKKENEPKDLKDISKQLDNIKKDFQNLYQEIEFLKSNNEFNIKKVEMIRYNPFSGVGGDQSFSVVVLDGKNNGFVLTSLYAQDGSRIYAKPIKKGISEYTLSEEEKQALAKATN
jgi:hypothetical protein